MGRIDDERIAFMKPFRWIILAALISMVANMAHAVDLNVESGLVSTWWDSDTDDRGNQTYIPVTIDAVAGNFSARVLSALVNTRIDPGDEPKDSLATVIDTKLNFSYAMIDRWPVDILFGLDLNLPTGKTDLDNAEPRLLLDPDLVAISRYGEGFNVNPTITIAKTGARWSAGIGVGFLMRGEYDFSDTVQDFDPGDIINITGEAHYAFNNRWQGRLFGEVAWYGTDEVDGEDYYQEGDFFLAGAGVSYYRDRWDADISFKSIFCGKCDFPVSPGEIGTEDRGGFGDEYLTDLVARFRLNPATTLQSRLYYLVVTENDYDGDDPSYIDGQEKISLAVSLQRSFTPTFSGCIGIEGFQLDQGRNWYHDDDREYRGLVVDASIKKAF
jgi:hypothetical protein